MLKPENIKDNFLKAASQSKEHPLPNYGELPSIELYMDQVISLIKDYLAPFSPLWEGRIVTRSMINNYVKLHIMPAPVNKRYRKEHLAYLIIICILKQTLPIRSIVALINLGLRHSTMENLYNSFVKNYSLLIFGTVEKAISRIDSEGANNDLFTDIVINMSISSATGRFLCESMIKEDGKIDPELLGDFALVEKDPGKVKKKKKLPRLRNKK